MILGFVKAFGMFWWDFLVGETPEVTVCVALVMIVGGLVAGRGWLPVVLLPAMVVLTLAITLQMKRKKPSK